MKLAVTVVAAFMVTVQVPVPLHPPPLQPVKREFPFGVAVKVTLVPLVKLVLQVLPQSIPAGLEVTEPVPVPLLVTVKAQLTSVKVAVTDCAAFMVTVQVPVPLQPPPLQPVKVEPPEGVAVSVTLVPLVKLALQVLPQLIPAGLEVTVPVPVPLLVTVKA